MPVEPLQLNFPHARTLVAVRSNVVRKGKLQEPDIRYYVASQLMDDRTPQGWLRLVRGHWAGCENRNHWRRDACWLEDKTRSRSPNIVGALALLRNALLAIVQPELECYGSLPAFSEAVTARPSLALNLLRSRS